MVVHRSTNRANHDGNGTSMRRTKFHPKYLFFTAAWTFLAYYASILLLPMMPPLAYTITNKTVSGEASYVVTTRSGGLGVRSDGKGLLLGCDQYGRSRFCLDQLSQAGLAVGQEVVAEYVEMRLLWQRMNVLVSVRAEGRTLRSCDQSLDQLNWPVT